MGHPEPVAVPQTAETLNELSDVAYVRNMRTSIINHLLDDKTGALPLGDQDKMELLTKQLDAIDRSALTRMRIKTDANKNDLTAGAQKMVAEALRNMSNRSGAIQPAQVVEAAARILTLPDEVVSSREEIEGESTIGSNNTTFDEFSKIHMVKAVEVTKPEARL